MRYGYFHFCVYVLGAFLFICCRPIEVKEGSRRFAVLHRMSSGQLSATPQFAQLQVTSECACHYEHLLSIAVLL